MNHVCPGVLCQLPVAGQFPTEQDLKLMGMDPGTSCVQRPCALSVMGPALPTSPCSTHPVQCIHCVCVCLERGGWGYTSASIEQDNQKASPISPPLLREWLFRLPYIFHKRSQCQRQSPRPSSRLICLSSEAGGTRPAWHRGSRAAVMVSCSRGNLSLVHATPFLFGPTNPQGCKQILPPLKIPS